MNELALRKTLKTLIENNELLLVSNLTFQGEPRVIHQITYSTMTPPTGYYFISISISDVVDANRTGFGTTKRLAPSQTTYSVVIEISDYAVSSSGENQMFEKMDGDFQVFTDRIIALLRADYRIVDALSNKEYVLDQDRTINKSNLSNIWEDAANYHAMLYSRITFRLIDECTNDSTLY